jgi:integrase
MHIRTVHGETPNTVNTSVVRTRRYLTGREVEKLMEAARKHGRYGHRDATMILLAYRHGLRARQFCLFLANRTSALSQGRRIGRSSNTLKWRSDVADGEALERDGRLLRQSVRLLGRQLLGLV